MQGTGSGGTGKRIVALAGGVGAARFLQGLLAVVPGPDVTVIVNVGDDAEMYGLHVSPDIDIVTYTLAGRFDNERGFGLLNDTRAVIDSMARFGVETWFGLGDRDLATCLYRTMRLRQGATLSTVTGEVARGFGLDLTMLPVTDDHLRTLVQTPAGLLGFQEYFVRRRTEDEVQGIVFDGVSEAKPAPGVLDAIAAADAILVAPSNPFVSIGPILSVPGVQEAIRVSRATKVAVSPIVGGEAIKGPAARMFRDLGLEASASGVAARYRELADVLVIDQVDAGQADAVTAQGPRAVVTDTIMRGMREKVNLARVVLEAAGW